MVSESNIMIRLNISDDIYIESNVYEQEQHTGRVTKAFLQKNYIVLFVYLHMIPSEWSLEIAVTISAIQCLIHASGIRICSDLAAVESSSLNTSDTVLWRDLGGDVSSCSMVAERHSSVEFNLFMDNLATGILFFLSELSTNVEDLEDFLLAFSERSLHRSSIAELTRVSFLSQSSVGSISSVVWHLSWSSLDPEELVSSLFRWIS